MRHKLATAAVLLLFGCQCGAKNKDKAARAPANVIDAREIVEATGTAAPYAPALEAPQLSEREQDRRPVAGGRPERELEPEPPAPPEEDPPVPTTGTFAEEAPAEEREAPADWPDGGLPPLPDASVEPVEPVEPVAPVEPEPPPPPSPSGPLEDAGDPLPDPDAHGG
jgi:hypothetical protein